MRMPGTVPWKSFQRGYIVPFVMWANYDMEAEEVDAISANYLSTLLMEKAGLPKTGYQEYLTQLQKDFPVVTANFFHERRGTGFPRAVRKRCR